MKKEYTSFEQKIKALFGKYSRLPLLVLVGVFVVVILAVYINQSVIKPKQATSQISKKFSRSLDDLDAYFESLKESEYLIETLKHESVSSHQYNLIYYRLTQTTGFELDYAIYNDSGSLLHSTQNIIDKTLYITNFNRLFLSRLKSDYTDDIMIESVNRIDAPTKYNMLVLGKQLVLGDDSYAILIYINPDSLSHLIDQYHVDQVVITDRFGYILSSSSDIFKDKLNRFNPNLTRNLTVENINFVDYISHHFGNQIVIHVLNVKQPLFYTQGVLIVFMILAFWVLKYTNDMIGKKVGEESSAAIKELVRLIDYIKQGQLGYTSDYTAHDELGYLIDEFNEMSKSLDVLVKKNESLIALTNQAQIKQLEAQFNPHFLYNSLDTIRFLIQQDPKKATEMIYNVTYLLRYSLDVTKEEILFKEDLDYVYKYLDIIKTRLNDRFSYLVEIESEVLNTKVPRLLIQPLIENSIKHGFKDKDRLEIAIYGFLYENSIYIGVHDSGSGIEKRRLDEIINSFKQKQNMGNNFGLYNLKQRLTLIYGETSELRITSSNEGTNIVIKIPNGGNHV